MAKKLEKTFEEKAIEVGIPFATIVKKTKTIDMLRKFYKKTGIRWKEVKLKTMVSRSARTKTTAKATARRLRKKGLNVSIFKKKKGFGISSTRK